MRMLLRVSIPVEAGNAAAKDGTLGPTIERILADLKPEAAYFFADDSGQRSGSIVFDMKDTSQIPAVAEPWFLAFNAQSLAAADHEPARSCQGRSIDWQGCQEIRKVGRNPRFARDPLMDAAAMIAAAFNLGFCPDAP